MSRNRCYGWADGDPVTCIKADGSVRAVGKVIVRKSAKVEWYLKVRIESDASGIGARGEYVWPEGWILGQGNRRGVCLECSQDYLTNDPRPSGFCLGCERRSEKEHALDSGIRNRKGFMYGARNKPETPKPLTDEQRERIRKGDEEKARDEQESPF